MSVQTPDSPFTPPNVPPSASHYTPPPHPPQPLHQPPPARSLGCGQFIVFGLIGTAILGVVGVAVLVGSVLLFSAVATDAFEELTNENREKTVTEKFIGGNQGAGNKIAVISIEGIIVGDSDGFVAKQIRRVMSDRQVKAVVLRVNSPGGTMTGSDYFLHLLKRMKSERKIPVVVSMGGIAASGGYYVSMIGDEIYAEPATITGSIGVIASLYDASELCKNIGVTSTPIVSGKHKAMGSFMKPMSDEERVIWQKLIDDNFNRFKDIIREGRKEFRKKPEDLDKLATGQVFSANDAVANGLIDKIGFLDDAVKQAGELANLLERDYKTIQYKPKLSLITALLENRVPDNLWSARTLSDITMPRVYMLCPYVLPVGAVE